MVDGERERERTRIIFRTIIDYSFAAYRVMIFSLKDRQLNIRETRKVTFRANGEGIEVLSVLGFPHSHPPRTNTTIQPSQPNPSRP